MEKDLQINVIMAKSQELKGIATGVAGMTNSFRKEERNRNVAYCLLVALALVVRSYLL